jgi:hypothetical protein
MTLSGGRNTTTKRRYLMLNEQTIEKLYAMKLNGMAAGFKEQLLGVIEDRHGLSSTIVATQLPEKTGTIP